MSYWFVQRHRVQHPLTRLCQAVDVSRSGYYAWRRRPSSAQALATRQLLVRMQQLHRQMKAPYGVVKLWRALRLIGARCSRHRVARLRRQYSLIAHGGSGRVFLD